MRRIDASIITRTIAGTAIAVIAALAACDGSWPVQPVEAGGAFISVSGVLDTTMRGNARFGFSTAFKGDSSLLLSLTSQDGIGFTYVMGGFSLHDSIPLAAGAVRQGSASLHVAVGTVAVADVDGPSTYTITGVTEGRLRGRVVMHGFVAVFANGHSESRPLTVSAIFDAVDRNALFGSAVQPIDSGVVGSRH
jgi:hypothetical protein